VEELRIDIMAMKYADDAEQFSYEDACEEIQGKVQALLDSGEEG
jgi:hypothetical protein